MISHYIITCVILVFISTGSTFTYPECRMPNGYTGECRYLDKCKPLMEVNEKDTKSEEELLYLRESSCGTSSNYKYKVCCPPQSEWSKTLNLKPIYYREILEYMSEPNQNRTNTVYRPTKKDTGTDSEDFYSPGDVRNGDRSNDPALTAFYEECGVQEYTNNKFNDDETAAGGQHPWLALLAYADGDYKCGGSLISLRYVLTAAHCMDSSIGQPTSVSLSEYNTTSYPTDTVPVSSGELQHVDLTIINIEWSEMHPLFTRTSYQHDIGLVKMSQDAPYSNFIRPICLPRYNYVKEFREGTNLLTSGWSSNGLNVNQVKKNGHLQYMPLQACKRSITTRSLTHKQICAGGKSKQACIGDSGGPLMFESDRYYTVVGVISYGPRECGKNNRPNVYTNVYEYLEWIDSKME